MSYPLNDDELRATPRLPADERYDYFVTHVLRGGEVWGLTSEAGWVSMISEEGEECLPIWPHERFAAAWATDDWADCKPTPIPLDQWLARWIPGMRADGTLLAVFPDADEPGVVVTPDELREAFESQR